MSEGQEPVKTLLELGVRRRVEAIVRWMFGFPMSSSQLGELGQTPQEQRLIAFGDRMRRFTLLGEAQGEAIEERVVTTTTTSGATTSTTTTTTTSSTTSSTTSTTSTTSSTTTTTESTTTTTESTTTTTEALLCCMNFYCWPVGFGVFTELCLQYGGCIGDPPENVCTYNETAQNCESPGPLFDLCPDTGDGSNKCYAFTSSTCSL